jgi:hypothetical protein
MLAACQPNSAQFVEIGASNNAAADSFVGAIASFGSRRGCAANAQHP